MPDAPTLPADAQLIALDPAKRYLVLLPTGSVPADSLARAARQINEQLHELGLQHLVVAMPDPQDVRIIEAPAP